MRAFAIAIVFASSVAAAQAPKTPAATPPQAAPAAQKPAAPAATTPAGQPQTSAPAQAQPPKPEAYTYEPEGRRDPFVSLVGTGIDSPVVKKGEGPAGMLVAEISVRGIMQSKGAYVAMIEGPDKKTYIVHSGDKLADGTIKSVMPTGLVIIQEVNDPLSLVKQREVRKLLRSLEDAK
jgi:type IV pilus assembly protein PilP